MLRIRNDLEVVEILRKEKSHVRKIASILKTTPSTVSRTLKNLEKEKVVNYKTEGKNKVYYLKDTVEAKTYLDLTENYKLLKAMQNPILRRIITTLKNQTNELVILFGSFAKGTNTENSDIDIYTESKQTFQNLPENVRITNANLDKNIILKKEIEKDHVIIQDVEKYNQLMQDERSQVHKGVNEESSYKNKKAE
ncbi:MAG: nucleotidyltransferase domain-containing protein [Candidatus Woesearchaeota archaeon]